MGNPRIAGFMLVLLVVSGCGMHTAKEAPLIAMSSDKDATAAELAQLRQEVRAMRAEMQNMSRQISRLGGPVGAGLSAGAKKPDTTVYDVKAGESPIFGAADAPVTIVAFMDYQCPYCPAEYERIKKIVNESKGKVRFVLKHHPLYMHKQASFAAAAAELARVNKGPEAFWAMSDMLFANNKRLQIADLRRYAQQLQLNLEQFDDVMRSRERVDILLSADKAEGTSCNISGTPAILINGLKLEDRTPAGYSKRINEIIALPAGAVTATGERGD